MLTDSGWHHPPSGADTALWDGLGSAVAGGLLAALATAGGIWWAQHLKDNRDASTAAQVARVRILEVMLNLRDTFAVQRRKRDGRFHLYPLRAVLASSWKDLHDKPDYEEVEALEVAADEFRRWSRAGSGGAGVQPGGAPEGFDPSEEVDEYVAALHSNAVRCIALLKGAVPAHPVKPYPALPWFVANPEEILELDE